MPVTHLDAAGLSKPETHHQVSVSTGVVQVHVAGQVSIDADGALVGKDDLAAQTAQAFGNVALALAAAGASFADVVRLRIYVAGWTPEMMPALGEGIARVQAAHGVGRPPTSLIGVSILFDPDYLIEVEATAVLDGVQP